MQEQVPKFIDWCQNLPLSEAIRGVKWPFPTIESLHLAGLVIVFGSILIVNLRIFGRVLKETPIVDVARGVAPITLVGLGVQALSGPLLFISNAAKFYGSDPFRLKLLLLAFSLTYHFAVHRPATFAADSSIAKLRTSAALSMTLWMSVVLAGMFIELLA